MPPEVPGPLGPASDGRRPGTSVGPHDRAPDRSTGRARPSPAVAFIAGQRGACSSKKSLVGERRRCGRPRVTVGVQPLRPTSSRASSSTSRDERGGPPGPQPARTWPPPATCGRSARSRRPASRSETLADLGHPTAVVRRVRRHPHRRAGDLPRRRRSPRSATTTATSCWSGSSCPNSGAMDAAGIAELGQVTNGLLDAVPPRHRHDPDPARHRRHHAQRLTARPSWPPAAGERIPLGPHRSGPLRSPPMTRVFSGIQPTGSVHLGNLLGALRNWVDRPARRPTRCSASSTCTP